MRALVQRVSRASVSIDGRLHSEIGRGFLVLLGVSCEDTQAEADYIIGKLPSLRLFADEKHPINSSLRDVGGSILLVSQFTLYGDVAKGNRPSFVKAAGGEQAEQLYNYVAEGLKAADVPVACGVFGADMQVELVNDGPVTILLERNAKTL